jgi:putative oxidoreductase
MAMQGIENTASLLGRVAMSLLFIHGGWGKLLAPAATQAMLTSHHLPMVKYGWILAVVVELGGGLALLVGLLTRPIGLVLAIWMGGFLYVAAFGGGSWSLDARRSRRGR